MTTLLLLIELLATLLGYSLGRALLNLHRGNLLWGLSWVTVAEVCLVELLIRILGAFP
jgi:hypothetical protein